MTEKEKMLRGDFYNSRDPELLGMYHRARQLLKEYNALAPVYLEERERILSCKKLVQSDPARPNLGLRYPV